MAKIAFLSNREVEGSFLSKSDNENWKALRHGLWQELSQDKWRNHTFLIPIYTRYDRLVLQIAEYFGNPVIFYLPTQEWGESNLPVNQIQCIQRMKARYPRIVIKGSNNRLNAMIHDSDGVFVLKTQDYLDVPEDILNTKRVNTLNPNALLLNYREAEKKKQAKQTMSNRQFA